MSLRSAEAVSAQPSASPELLHEPDAPTLRPPVRLVHSASGGSEQGTSARSSGRKPSSREAVRALLREYHQRGDRHARDRVIQQYMPLVKSLARRHSNRGELYEDLVQVGAIGLIKAVDRFDDERSVDFGAFAIPTIAGEIKRYLRDRTWPIKIPRRLQELRPGLCACSAELSAQLERPATIAEIAEHSGVGEPEVEEALALERIQSPVSLSLTTGRESDDGYGEVAGTLDGGFELGEQRAVLAAGFRVLTARERRLLHLRFFAGLSQPQIAREVGISQIHVSRLTRRALEKLRSQIGPVPDLVPVSDRGAG
jgi:RNA polymerase sigma-B factor